MIDGELPTRPADPSGRPGTHLPRQATTGPAPAAGGGEAAPQRPLPGGPDQDPGGAGRRGLVLLGTLVALLAALFVALGIWQLDRLGQVRERNRLLRSRLEQEPLNAAALPAAPSSQAVEGLALRRTTATGRYDVDEQILIRSRQHRGQNGFHVLTPLRQEGGPAVLVNRGWIPVGSQAPPVDRAAPPADQVEVTGILRDSEEAGLLGPRDPPTGELKRAFRIDVERLSHQLPYAVVPLWVQLTDQRPAQGGPLPVPAPPPDLDEGPHLSYAIQWFSFAMIAVVGFAAYARRRRA